MNRKTTAASRGNQQSIVTLPHRINAMLRQMAPHQRSRETAVLLEEAAVELIRLSDLQDEDDDAPDLSPIRTKRFTIHRHEIKRDDSVGGMPRTVFQAWHHSEDIPKPVCVVTINQCFSNFVEWVHVDEGHRRQGVATEVLRAIEQGIGEATIDGATDAGKAFCEAYESKYPSEVE